MITAERMQRRRSSVGVVMALLPCLLANVSSGAAEDSVAMPLGKTCVKSAFVRTPGPTQNNQDELLFKTKSLAVSAAQCLSNPDATALLNITGKFVAGPKHTYDIGMSFSVREANDLLPHKCKHAGVFAEVQQEMAQHKRKRIPGSSWYNLDGDGCGDVRRNKGVSVTMTGVELPCASLLGDGTVTACLMWRHKKKGTCANMGDVKSDSTRGYCFDIIPAGHIMPKTTTSTAPASTTTASTTTASTSTASTTTASTTTASSTTTVAPSTSTSTTTVSGPITGVKCAVGREKRTDAVLDCGLFSVIDSINFASYGNPTGDTDACVGEANPLALGACHAESSVRVVEEHCLGLESCEVTTSNDMFTDPCKGQPKELWVQYTCRAVDRVNRTDELTTISTTTTASTTATTTTITISTASTTTTVPTTAVASTSDVGMTVHCASGEERRSDANLVCPEQSVIGIVFFASYGTPTGTCSAGLVQGSCHAATTQAVTQATCAGKQQCLLPIADSGNDLFGDPCDGTHKFYEVMYTCVPSDATTTTTSESTTTSTAAPTTTTTSSTSSSSSQAPRCPTGTLTAGTKNGCNAKCRTAGYATGSFTPSSNECDASCICEGVATTTTQATTTTSTAAGPPDSFHCASGREHREDAILECPTGSMITEILFASYGQPLGEDSCDEASLAYSRCHAESSHTVVEQICLGQNKCTVGVVKGNDIFSDPCPGDTKWFKAHYVCGGSVPASTEAPSTAIPSQGVVGSCMARSSCMFDDDALCQCDSLCQSSGDCCPDIMLSICAQSILTTVPPTQEQSGPDATPAPWSGEFTVNRLLDGPLIAPDIFPEDMAEDGTNINGPSLIKVPSWVQNRLGEYYLYFSHHRDSYIRMAYADSITGPWTLHRPGVLHMDDAPGADHIASPDMIVDEATQTIRMYFHQPEDLGGGNAGPQFTWVSTSSNGLDFTVVSHHSLGPPYFRVFEHGGQHYALAKNYAQGGIFMRSTDADGLKDFVPGPSCIDSMRHAAVWIEGDTLFMVYSRIYDKPESLVISEVDISGPWTSWQCSEPELLLKADEEWEGGNLPVERSRPGAVNQDVRELRDPGIYRENGKVYLLYSYKGERGIGLAEIVRQSAAAP